MTTLVLRVSEELSAYVPTWSRMVKEQLDLTGEEAITPVNFSESDLGDVIAMEDRNNGRFR